ncbi:hypothetical protein [Proteus sp. ZN5]|uniref:hypothetical protein n=1 Tax=Proteus sp. ZN5 TaxID=2697019 RepID=UPI0013E12185|nr:hypothetical protein [Proteus sp. ZN5]QIG04620.1 hypothetical protein GTK47_04360 [Proteus sp. ZN5]
MIFIKTDNLILNRCLINEQSNEVKSTFSKKSSPFSIVVELLNIEKEKFSSEEFSKIKQKLDIFHDLNYKRTTDIKEISKINSNKSVDELEDKKEKREESEYLNIEGLLLTQRKIYSQICSFEKGCKIEKKSLFHYGNKPSHVANNVIIENDLNLPINLKSKQEKKTDISADKNELKINPNNLTLRAKDEKVNQKEEKQNETNKINEHIENERYPNELKTKKIKNKITLKIEENKLNTKNDAIVESNNLFEKDNYQNNKEINNKSITKDVENRNSNVENLSGILPASYIKPEFQQAPSGSSSFKRILDIPAFSILYKKVSVVSQPPSITYVFKKWGSEFHQMKVNFDIDKKIQLIASTGRVYQSSLENFNQYQGRLYLLLENDNSHWHINAIDPSSENKEDDK